MEDENQKKKHKKKKGKQRKATEHVKNASGETESRASEQDQPGRDLEGAYAPRLLESVEKLDTDQNVGAKGVILEQKVKQLENEKNSCIQKEVILEEKVKQLEIEKNSCIQREVTLEEKVKQLEVERDSCIEREVGFEKEIMDLVNEKDSWVEREASMEEKIKQLLNEKASWSFKQASLEDRIKQLETENESCIVKEKSTNEMIARFDEENMSIKLQVKVLQDSRDGLLQENQHLTETLSFLQSKIQLLEKENSSSLSSTKTEKVHNHLNDEAIGTQMEAATVLVEKLITENAELVEKVNELYLELNQRSILVGHSPKAGSDHVSVMIETGPVSNDMPELSEKTSESLERMLSPASFQPKDVSTSLANGQSTMVAEISAENSLGPYEAMETDEIVQIPLDESDIGEVEVQPTPTEEKSSVALIDAPLTGAPFRMISYFARYVSGADLVNRNSSISGR